MATEKYVSDKTQIGVSDYLGAAVIHGVLWLVPYRKIKTNIDNIEDRHLFEGTVNVQYGQVSDYLLAPGEGLRVEANKLSTGDSFECSLLTWDTEDVKNPDIIVDDFQGLVTHTNDTSSDQNLRLSIQPLFGATENSRYDVKISSIISDRSIGHTIEEDYAASSYQDYPIAPKMVASWDIIRHKTVKLDFTFGYGSGEITGQETIVVNSHEGMTHVFPFKWDKPNISKVDVVVNIMVEDDDGIFSIFPKISEMDVNPSDLYGEYEENLIEYESYIDDIKNNREIQESTIIDSSSSGGSNSSTGSSGY
tara:strand:+ start:1940 stop:2860 length:921 start_codon:yes stop_codon:yes gene_type:complete